MSRSTIYLNKGVLEGRNVIKLYYKKDELVFNRIKSNDWIKYSVEDRVCYCDYSEEKIGLLKDLFSDLATVNIFGCNAKAQIK